MRASHWEVEKINVVDEHNFSQLLSHKHWIEQKEFQDHHANNIAESADKKHLLANVYTTEKIKVNGAQRYEVENFKDLKFFPDEEIVNWTGTTLGFDGESFSMDQFVVPFLFPLSSLLSPLVIGQLFLPGQKIFCIYFRFWVVGNKVEQILFASQTRKASIFPERWRALQTTTGNSMKKFRCEELNCFSI